MLGGDLTFLRLFVCFVYCVLRGKTMEGGWCGCGCGCGCGSQSLSDISSFPLVRSIVEKILIEYMMVSNLKGERKEVLDTTST